MNTQDQHSDDQRPSYGNEIQRRIEAERIEQEHNHELERLLASSKPRRHPDQCLPLHPLQKRD